MSDVLQMLVMAKYQFKSYMRAKRLYIILLITALVIALIVGVNSYFGNPSEDTVKKTAMDFANFAPTLVVLTALFFGGDAIASEYQNKTGYFLLPNPVKRWAILWGKYIASLLAGTLIVSIYYIAGTAYTYYFHNSVPIELGYSYLYALLFLASLMWFTYLFSSFFKSGAVALTVVAILYFFVFNIVDGVSQIAGVEPWFSITYASAILTLVFEGQHMGDYAHSQTLGHGLSITIYHPYLWEGCVIMLSYLLISAVLTMVIFNRREMK